MQSHKSFTQYLDNLSSNYGIDPELIFDGVNKKKKSSFSANELLQIADNLHVDSVNLLEQSIDIEALKLRLNNSNDLPSSYLHGAYSSTTSLASVVSEFKKFGRYDQLLKMVQITPEVLKTHRPLSVHVVQKVLLYMKNFISDEEIKGIAKRNSHAFLTECEFGRIFFKELKDRNPAELMFENVHLVEKNWDYNIVSSSSNSVIIDTAQSEEMMDISNQDYTTNHLVALRFEFFKQVFERIGTICDVTQLTPVEKNGHFKFQLKYSKVKRPVSDLHLLYQ